MASIAASRFASNSVRCSRCNYSILNAFASVSGAQLRRPETLRAIPGRAGRGRITAPTNRQFHSSRFFLKENTLDEKVLDETDASRQPEKDEFDGESKEETSAIGASASSNLENLDVTEANSSAYEEEFDLESESELEEEGEGGEPWYLSDDAVPPPPVKFVSPFLQPVPDAPPDSPPFMKDLFTHLIKDLGFLSLSVHDLRGVDSATSLGDNLIVLICTARSPRHLHIGSDKCIRFMRANFHFRARADGLIPKAEIRLKERRRRRKGKVLTAAEEEENTVRWVCIDTGKGVLIQVMTKDKREDVNLEGLLQKELERSERKKARGEERIREFLEANKDHTLENLKVEDLLKDEPPVKLRGVRSRVIKRQNVWMYNKPGRNTVSGPFVPRREFHWHGWNQVTSASVGLSAQETRQSDAAGGAPLHEKVTRSLRLAVRDGDYEKLMELIPRPWSYSEKLMILESHLNHLRLITQKSPRLAVEQLLSSDESNPWASDFMKSFWKVFNIDPTPAMFHTRVLLFMHAHFIEKAEFSSDPNPRNVYKYELFSEIPQQLKARGLSVLPETYYLILRALATSPELRPGSADYTGDEKVTDARLQTMIPVMELMTKDNYDLMNDVAVQSALFFATCPASTSIYMSELGDMNCPRRTEVKGRYMAPRQYDPRLKGFLQKRLKHDPGSVHNLVLDSTVSQQARPAQVVHRAPTKNLPMIQMNPLAHTGLAKIPLPDATALVVFARAQDWPSFFKYYRTLLYEGFDLPPEMYSLIFQLVAREGSPTHAIHCLRNLWTDLQQEQGEMVFDHGIAAGIVGCFRELKHTHSELLHEFRELKYHVKSYLRTNGMDVTKDYRVTDFFHSNEIKKGRLLPQSIPFMSVGPVAVERDDSGYVQNDANVERLFERAKPWSRDDSADWLFRSDDKRHANADADTAALGTIAATGTAVPTAAVTAAAAVTPTEPTQPVGRSVLSTGADASERLDILRQIRLWGDVLDVLERHEIVAKLKWWQDNGCWEVLHPFASEFPMLNTTEIGEVEKLGGDITRVLVGPDIGVGRTALRKKTQQLDAAKRAVPLVEKAEVPNIKLRYVGVKGRAGGKNTYIHADISQSRSSIRGA